MFGADDVTVERIVVEHLAARGWTVATREEATLGQVGARIAIIGERVFKGSAIGAGQPPAADVMLMVGPVGPDLDSGPRTTRQVQMEVITPAGVTTRLFDFGGDDERVRTFATIAGLHLVRVALEAAG